MATTGNDHLSCHPMSVPLGYGAAGLGNLYEIVPDAVADATLAEAWDAGFRYFDTSPWYGFGLSELRVGRFLRALPRDRFLLSTKVGRYMVPLRGASMDTLGWAGPLELRPVFDYSYSGAMHSIEQSVIRLGFEQIDILFIHDADRRNHGEEFPRIFAAAMDGAYRALDELRGAGHVHAIGVGVNEADVAADFILAGTFDCIMLAGRYTLLDQSALDVFLPLAESRGIDVFMVGVFNSGILAKPTQPRPTYDYVEAPPEIVHRANRIAAICSEYRVPIQAAAIQFPRGHPAVKTIVLGMSKPDRIRQNLAWASMEIPTAMWERLKAEGLIRADAPLPQANGGRPTAKADPGRSLGRGP
jgi:D-threo-aldose 1-dehydrogenase